MKQDLAEIKKILYSLGFSIIKLEIHTNGLREAGAPLFADKIERLTNELNIVQLAALKSLGEDVE